MACESCQFHKSIRQVILKMHLMSFSGLIYQYTLFHFVFLYINIFNKAFAPKAQMLIWEAYAQKIY